MVVIIVVLKALVNVTAIAEVMALVNHYEIVVAPVDTTEVYAIALAVVTGEVGVEEDVITETVGCNRIILVVSAKRHPVVVQLLGTKDKHALVPVLIVLDNGKSRESLTKSNGVSKYAAIVLLQLVDDGKGCITLEVIELVPNDAVLEARALIGQHILGDVLQELVEDIVQRDEVDVFRCILVIDGINVVEDTLSDIGEMFVIIPLLVENF